MSKEDLQGAAYQMASETEVLEALEILKEPARPLFLPDQLVQLEAKKSGVKQ